MVMDRVFYRRREKRYLGESVRHDPRNSSIEKRLDNFKNDLLNRFLVNPF